MAGTIRAAPRVDWSRPAGPVGRKRLLGALVAVLASFALALLGAWLGVGRSPVLLVWIAYIASALAMLASAILAASSLVHETGWALVIGYLAYLWPLPIALGVGLVGRYPVDELGELLLGSLLWPVRVFQGAIFCPLGLPCPLGR